MKGRRKEGLDGTQVGKPYLKTVLQGAELDNWYLLNACSIPITVPPRFMPLIYYRFISVALHMRRF